MGTTTESTLIDELRALLAANQLLTDPADIRPYGFDGTAGLKGTAAAVVFPNCTEEVAAIVKLAAKYDTAIVTRGTGTGLSGGCVPSEHSIVICTVEMNRILETDTQNLTMLVEPGVITKEIDEASAAHNLFYPPDPSSMKISTIGGNVANNSGGLRGLKYGVTRDYVMGLEVVTADGTVQWLGGKCVKDVAGYSLRDVFIGSEGTLGLITKILIKLIPRPKAKSTLLATFPSMQQAAETVSAIIAAQIIPCTLEFLDRKTIRCVEDFAKVGLPDCEALLFMETDGHPVVVAEEAEAMEAIARKCGATEVTRAKDDFHAIQLATARRSAFSALARIRPTTILEDATVPRSKLVEMVSFIEATAKKYDLQIATFGHMGDGNLHPTFLTDERDHKEMERVEAAMKAIFDFTIQLGGTITGEHGVGLAKRKFLPTQFDAGSYALLSKIKGSLDPHNRLNPGKIFDLDLRPVDHG
jgi:glycolate oxidase